MIETIESFVQSNPVICITGLLLHVLLKWGEARQLLSSSPPNLLEYAKSVPAQTSIAVVAAVGMYGLAGAMEWMNPGTAFACGYVGNSMAENFAKKFSQVPPP